MGNRYVKPCLNDQQWMGDAWEEGVDLASKETAVADFPEYLPWTAKQILDAEFFSD